MTLVDEHVRRELFTWEWARDSGIGWDSLVKNHCGAPVWVFDCEKSCSPHLIKDDGWGDVYKLNFRICPMCGWRVVHEDAFIRRYPPDHIGRDSIYRIIKKFKVDDQNLCLDELGAHLRRRFSDIYYISPRTFEKLVADIYKHAGYDVILTPATRDGGKDIILLGKDGERIIVECKRYSRNRKVGVGVINSILGVQLALGERRARIVTTSYFTFPAEERAKSASLVEQGYILEFVDAEQLLRLLSVYNTDMPSLDVWATEAQSRANEAQPEPAFCYDNWPAELGNINVINVPKDPDISYSNWLWRTFRPNE